MRAFLLLLTVISTCPPAFAEDSGSDWVIDWSSIDGGGEIDAPGGTWRLSGSLGQWDASPASGANGGAWAITGGFWSVARVTDTLFEDGFESGLSLGRSTEIREE